MSIALLTLSVFVTLAAAAFFAGAETGFLSVSRERVLHLAREGGRKAKIVERALADMSRTTTMLLIGNNLASVAYSSASAALVLALASDSRMRAVGSFLAAFLVLYVSEFLPKLLCAARPLRRILALAPVYRAADAALAPLTALAMALTGLFVPRRGPKYTLTAADIQRILRDRQDGVCLSDIESALVCRIVSLRVANRPVTPEALLAALADGNADTCKCLDGENA